MKITDIVKPLIWRDGKYSSTAAAPFGTYTATPDGYWRRPFKRHGGLSETRSLGGAKAACYADLCKRLAPHLNVEDE